MAKKSLAIHHEESLLSDRQQRELVARVANSRSFASSSTLRAFFLYVAEHAIAGEPDGVKEQQIGFHVLGRKPDYDPADDNIVRVRARQVRQKIDEYFGAEGQHEQVIISIPKGSYLPVFQPRPQVSREENSQPPHPDVRQPGIFSRSGALIFSWSITALALILLLGFRSDTRPAAVKSADPGETAYELWGQFFPAGNEELRVVAADSGFALWQDLTGQELTLGDYLSRAYLQKSAVGVSRELAIRRITSPADVILTLRLQEMARRFGGHVKSQFARNLDIHDLQSGNIVLLGSRRSNPWVELFESQLNFALTYNNSGGAPAFENKAPRPGELGNYALESPLTMDGPESRATESYALAALVPSLNGRGKVFILEGLGMEGTEAIGEFVTNGEKLAGLLRRIGARKNSPVKPFEALLKLTAVAGGYADAEVIASRYPLQHIAN